MRAALARALLVVALVVAVAAYPPWVARPLTHTHAHSQALVHTHPPMRASASASAPTPVRASVRVRVSASAPTPVRVTPTTSPPASVSDAPTPVSVAHTPTRAPVSEAHAAPVSDATSTDTPDWACIRERESGDNYTESGMEPEGGAYQFNLTTWASLGFSGMPAGSPAWVQDQAALALYKWDARYTWSPWSAWQTAPACGL